LSALKKLFWARFATAKFPYDKRANKREIQIKCLAKLIVGGQIKKSYAQQDKYDRGEVIASIDGIEPCLLEPSGKKPNDDQGTNEVNIVCQPGIEA